MPEEEHEKKLTSKRYITMRIKTSRQDLNVYLRFLFSRQLTSLSSRLWSGCIISRRWLWNDRSWHLLHLGHLNFTVLLRHSLSEVLFAENSWGKIGGSTFSLALIIDWAERECSTAFIIAPLDSGSRTPTYINILQWIQNFASKIVTNSRKFDHVTPLLRHLNWLPVKQRLYYRDSVLTYKCFKGLTPKYRVDKLTKCSSIYARHTRKRDLLRIPLYRIASDQHTSAYSGTSIWNNLDNDIKQCVSLQSLKQAIKGQHL